jgi:hypothetical protein
MLIDLSRVRVSGQLSAFATGFAAQCLPGSELRIMLSRLAR